MHFLQEELSEIYFQTLALREFLYSVLIEVFSLR